ncbi:hypothetical protein TrLO_g12348 [Triparma laevis f. longispina]|uniref:Uncharacterized protein n=1 Tax=Triparma laevis f. longispina TaxID=1714387 RepID=A0A9W7FUN4_9STRA|nr:hypothetical protein TrLO_g12348 [Triparma laevis f. longispina]
MSDVSSSSDYEEDFDLDESLGESNTSSIINTTSKPLSVRTSSQPDNKKYKLDSNPNNTNDLQPITSTKSVVENSNYHGSVSFVSHSPKTRVNRVSGGSSRKSYSDTFTNESDSRTTATGGRKGGGGGQKKQSPKPQQGFVQPSADASIVLPRHIVALREEVEKVSKTSDKGQLLLSLSQLERAMLQYKSNTLNSQMEKAKRAREKQARAEARRANHFKDMHALKKGAAEKSKEHSKLLIENEKLRHELESAKAMHESKESKCSGLQKLADERKKEVEKVKSEGRVVEGKVKELQQSLDESKNIVEEQVQHLKQKESQIKVMEKQLTITVEQLPARQSDIIKREEERLKRWEERLQDAEVKQNMNQVDIDSRRERAREEIKVESQEATARGLAEVEIARRKLNQAVEEFENDRKNLRSSISKVEAEQDAKFRAFNAERLAFESRVKKFKEEKLKFEIEKTMFEPSMIELRGKRDEAEKMAEELRDGKASLELLDLKVKREFLRLDEKEKDLEIREHHNNGKEQTLAIKDKEHNRQSIQLSQQLTNLQQARLQVHEQQLAVSKEVSEVKRALIQLRSLEGRVNLNRNALQNGNPYNNMMVVVENRENENNNNNKEAFTPTSPSKLQSIEALERAIHRCSASLDELTLRSRSALNDISVPSKAVATVAGIGSGLPPPALPTPPPTVATEYSTSTIDTTRASSKMKLGARQILGANASVVFSSQAAFAAQRMRQSALSSI